MDKPIKIIPGYGEVGIDSAASSGNGPYYAKTYDGAYDAVGFASVEEAFEELQYLRDLQGAE